MDNNVNSYIEYTNLKSPKTKEIRKLVETANEKGYKGVCLQPGDLSVANKYKSKDLKIVTVAGFPPIQTFHLFKSNTENHHLKLALGFYNKEQLDTIKYLCDTNTSDELDVVFPLYWYMTGKLVRIHKFLKGIKERYQRPVKVIIELGTIFNDRVALYEIMDILQQANIDYLKTNTGLIKQDFKKLYSTLLYLKVLMKDLDKELPIKASGGIRTKEEVLKLIKCGICRVGTSSAI